MQDEKTEDRESQGGGEAHSNLLKACIYGTIDIDKAMQEHKAACDKAQKFKRREIARKLRGI